MPNATRLLDLTRSLRRVGRMATGIDRVERAYLAQFLAQDIAVFGLVRTPIGYLLIARDGLEKFYDRLEGRSDWGAVSPLSRLGRGRAKAVRCAESDLRRLARGKARRGKLADLLRAHLPGEFQYFNVGHSNLTARVLTAVKAAQGNTHVLVHDVIPLDYPQFQREGSVEKFRMKLQCVSKFADRVIFNSFDTKDRAEVYFEGWGRVPDCIVAHLGTMRPQPDTGMLPSELPPKSPYFVVVGTIEPRKNHMFLLDIWEALGSDAPHLLICGSRGWNNDAVFERLSNLSVDSPIQEYAGLSDSALAALIQGGSGTLFPSLAEGFGLPPAEALALGSRVLCNDLPVFREFLNEKAVYASVSERYLWISTIKSWVNHPPVAQNVGTCSGPSWDDHFKAVLRF